MTKPKAFLSIDWDYFVPEDPWWDLGHKEAQFFHSALWTNRIHLFKEARTNGQEVGFWAKLKTKFNFKTELLTVSDSHLSVWYDPRLHKARTLILIDAHHDVFNDAADGRLDCGNWVAGWLNNKKTRHVYWIKADHSWGDEVAEAYYQSRVTVVDDVNRLPKFDIVGLHVCRSGCWTPPWLDGKFQRFVLGSEMNIAPLRPDLCDNPMEPRWNLATYRQAFQNQGLMAKMLKEHQAAAALRQNEWLRAANKMWEDNDSW